MRFTELKGGLRSSVVDFLRQNEKLIDANNFTELYKLAEADHIDILHMTLAFYAAGIDPLEYMQKVLENYLDGCRSCIGVDIPEGIEILGESCFFDTNAVSITLPETVHTIESYALAGMDKLEELTILGKLRDVHALSIWQNPSLEIIYTLPENQEFIPKSYRHLIRFISNGL